MLTDLKDVAESLKGAKTVDVGNIAVIHQSVEAVGLVRTLVGLALKLFWPLLALIGILAFIIAILYGEAALIRRAVNRRIAARLAA